ncbi:uncharacterized protein C8Q71DRAFT_701214 [Rhodofomes roseus]|uniref:Uncharacterized protein n=1 Tax=Rhodofomes roseus TaxID=34475 RepID=A0ABQ8KTK1_9APHY|nr:uncharacterized protein C8Q71DRAFT_701214 [Rhodofomes roseus]KAH9842042.1 hypothetical protein C8Q71DRAFT_701214 [Rhodofomes roseus]
MRREKNDSPFLHIASEAEVKVYNPRSRGGECCSAEDFRYDISGKQTSDWNSSVARVFAADFQARYPRFQKSNEAVAKAWRKHTETLRRQYQEQQRDQESAMKEQSYHRQCERKRQLYSRRTSVATKLPDNKAVQLMCALGVHGMSTDESDHPTGGGEATYYIRSKTWRSPELQTWLRTLDSLHLWARYRGSFKASQGGWPHFRVPCRKNSDRPPVIKLPRNCYAPWLLQSSNEFQLKLLDPNSRLINLQHSEDVQK